MGTISDRNIEDFGDEVGEKAEGLRASVRERFEGIEEKLEETIDANTGLEGEVTRKLEKVTSVLPSISWLGLAGVAFAGTVVFKVLGRHDWATVTGPLVPSLLLIGLYNKLVKVAGSDRVTEF